MSEGPNFATSVGPAATAYRYDDRVPEQASSDDGPTFADFLSILNPLQHLPIIGSIYRAITGDTIKPEARIFGGALFGGPIGLITAVVNAIVEQATGKDIGAQALALFKDDAPVPAGVAADLIAEQPAPAADAPPDPQTAAKLAAIAPAAGLPRTTGSAASPASGRTLADYQSGRPFATATGMPVNRPVPGRITVPPNVLAAERRLPAADIPAPSDEKNRSVPPMPGQDQVDAWFAATMLHGLDRYMDMKRLDRPTPAFDQSY